MQEPGVVADQASRPFLWKGLEDINVFRSNRSGDTQGDRFAQCILHLNATMN
jgi:hypothetical protein